MSMDINTVHKVARLAALDIDDAGAEKIAPQLSNILGFIEQLSEVNTEGVEPLANVVDIELALRKDEITDGDCREKVLANAPEETQGFFVVPKVVEQES
ncbi:MAG: Asp-tRNA(Asn)/Glu-tRNA(Gln) amidotransferase GatCAB subunit C [Micavibrio sp.]|nr:Asp-tRNA(Asn)/Glu-tRNA(Gln) amidotransferase GatCAB subunit C [Micavibrio sp.]